MKDEELNWLEKQSQCFCTSSGRNYTFSRLTFLWKERHKCIIYSRHNLVHYGAENEKITAAEVSLYLGNLVLLFLFSLLRGEKDLSFVLLTFCFILHLIHWHILLKVYWKNTQKCQAPDLFPDQIIIYIFKKCISNIINYIKVMRSETIGIKRWNFQDWDDQQFWKESINQDKTTGNFFIIFFINPMFSVVMWRTVF